jgi:hypothetical protein
VKMPRFRIAWLMVAVAIAAVDFGAIRVVLAPDMFRVFKFWVFGALPMANVLVVGLLVARYRPESRSFLLGFEGLGAIAMAVYIFVPREFSDFAGTIMLYLDLGSSALVPYLGTEPSLVVVALYWLLVLAMLVGPQLVFALIGGFLSRRFKSTVMLERRRGGFEPPRPVSQSNG